MRVIDLERIRQKTGLGLIKGVVRTGSFISLINYVYCIA